MAKDQELIIPDSFGKDLLKGELPVRRASPEVARGGLKTEGREPRIDLEANNPETIAIAYGLCDSREHSLAIARPFPIDDGYFQSREGAAFLLAVLSAEQSVGKGKSHATANGDIGRGHQGATIGTRETVDSPVVQEVESDSTGDASHPRQRLHYVLFERLDLRDIPEA